MSKGCGGKQEGSWHKENERAFRHRQVHRLGKAAHAVSVQLRFFAVVFNRLFERAERIDGLLKDFDHGNAAHIFRSRLRHFVLRTLINQHEFGVLSAHHHAEHGNRNDR